jgi:hypothetical protein
MCDYSLMSVDNRLAVCGEELMVHRFEIFSRGLASVADVEAVRRAEQPPRTFLEKVKRAIFPADPPQCPAVCIPPGARLLLRDIPERLQHELNLDSDEQEVVFTQIDTTGYRDAVRFANGAEVLLQRLSERQRVRVLALSSDEEENLVGDESAVISHAAVRN